MTDERWKWWRDAARPKLQDHGLAETQENIEQIIPELELEILMYVHSELEKFGLGLIQCGKKDNWSVGFAAHASVIAPDRVAMTLPVIMNDKSYRQKWPPAVAAVQAKLAKKGITVSVWEGELDEHFSGLGESKAESQVPVADRKLASNIGIETLNDVSTTLIEAGTPIPCERREIFSTAFDKQTEIEIHVLQGSSPRASENISLGKFKITGLPKDRRGVPKIEVAFRVQPNSEFVLVARDLKRRVDLNVVRV